MTWQPNDAELDAVARALPAPDTERARAEETRTALLASVASRAQLPRRSRAPWIALGAAVAAAAVIVVWIGVRPGPAPVGSGGATAGKRQAILAIGSAAFTRGEWPDYVVHLDDGRIGVEVAAVQAGERFRVVTSDAEVEVRGTKFEVAATHGLIAEVAVHEGRVEVRADGRVIVLASGETWTAARTARRDLLGSNSIATADVDATKHDTTNADATKHDTTNADATKHDTTNADAVKQVAAPKHDATKHAAANTDAAKHVGSRRADTSTDAKPLDAMKYADAANTKPIAGDAVKGDATKVAVPTAPKPGEDEFRAGWTALRAGDAAAATKLFASACSRAASDALGEDACFWAGAAAKRANDTKTARAALAHFLDRFPASARAPEASALLGWILYDANDLDAAEAQFRKAEHDKVPKVRDSAVKGLEAIARKRAQ
jgi:TolA-binding protein